uniref:Putative 4Fe-4S ferredoxin-type, iron-sulfur binding domain-containing protein n=1 Tax=Helianthus annuus TaxID=4232 RepID=A0A251U3G1_HELAN
MDRSNVAFSKIYDTCIGCTQCVRACPTDVLEMIPWDGFHFLPPKPVPKISYFWAQVFLVQVYLVFTTNKFPWLTIIVVLPIFAGSLIFFLPHKGNRVIRWYTICICMLELLLTTYAFCYHFQLDDPLIQLVEDYKWINFFDFRWKLGIDGLSLGPVLLTGFITTLATLAAWPVTRDSRLFHFLMLAMYSGQ